MKAALRSILAFLSLGMISCDGEDPLDPCADENACVVEGVDLAILRVTPRWTADQRYRSEVDARVVDPGDTIEVDVVVMNRGMEAATDSVRLFGRLHDHQLVIIASDSIPPLAVGERRTVRMRFPVAHGPRYIAPFSYAWGPGEFFLDSPSLAETDQDLSNNRGVAFEFHPRAPILSVAVEGLPDTLRSMRHYPATLRVTNTSPFVVFDGDLLTFCMSYPGHGYCESGSIDPFSPAPIGPLTAQATSSFAAMIHFTTASLWYFDGPSYVDLAPCTEPAEGALLRCLLNGLFNTVVIPDLMAECSPPVLASGDTLNVLSATCVHDYYVEPITYAVAAFEGVAGECWQAELVSGEPGFISVRDANLDFAGWDGERGCRVLARSGSHYLIVRAAAGGTTVGDGQIVLRRL